MDHSNLFFTPTTHRLMRVEYALGLIGCVVLMAIHVHQLSALHAAILFVYIDAIGYVPGAIAYRRSADRRISKAYYVLYNLGHSFTTGAVVAGLWALIVGPEWALLVIPAHLCGDRALFGNFPKAFGVAFEPEAHPTWAQVADQLARPPADDRAPGYVPAGAHAQVDARQPLAVAEDGR